jgi:hypothetical protein
MFPNHQFNEASVSGVASVDIEQFQTSGRTQISIHNATGSGTVTLEGKPAGVGEFQPIQSGSVDLSDANAIRTFTVDASLRTVRATSSNTADSFSLAVGT